ncbi:MAG: magnesium transporter [Clostridia bacterium]|nr:magnesium transporter [Clostridia bacterium]
MTREEQFESILSLIEENKWAQVQRILCVMNPVDTAEVIGEMEGDKMLLAFRILPKDLSADVFSYMDPDQQAQIVQSISNSEIRLLMDELYMDDAIDMLEELPSNVVTRVLASTDEQTRQRINQFLNYPENSAGSLMTIEYVELKRSWTAAEAMESIRRTAPDKETIYSCYVVDSTRKLVGIVALRQLIIAEPDTKIEELMNDQVIYCTTTDDQEQVAEMVRHYDLIALPVVDRENRLVGIITIDDVVDVITEENTEDFEKMAGMLPSEDEYLRTSPLALARNRLPWLLVLMFSAGFTGAIITKFQDMLQTMVILSSFIPMLMNTGGNCGSQASTMIIRGMALGQIEFKDIWRVQWKELRVGLLVAVPLGLINFLHLAYLKHIGVFVSATVALTLVCTVVVAKLIGCTLPMLAQKFRLDPAIMASPMITTIVDTCSLAVYFTLARMLLGL